MFLSAILAATIASATSGLPVPVEIRVPEFPEAAVKARMTAVVEVSATVLPDGSVSNAVVVGDAPPLLSASALNASREWRFAGSAVSEKRAYVIRYEFVVDADVPRSDSLCYVGPSTATVMLPLQTVRIRGLLRPPTNSVTGVSRADTGSR